MHPDRTHRAISHDGTTIVGRVDGQGPPLVLVHGSLEDGDQCWEAMLPYLRPHFTCYLPSTRNRGRSGESDDLSPRRRVEDIVSFVDSIGDAVSVFGESDGGALALGAAEHSDAVTAVAAYEPVVFEVADQVLQDTLQDTLPRVGDAMTDGEVADAARIFSEVVANDDELSSLTSSGYLEEAGRYVPVLLEELDQGAQPQAPSATDPALLAQITVPTLLMHGARSARRGWFTDGVAHVAEHVSDPHVRAIDGAGHFGVACAPEPIAEELTRFLATAPPS